MQLKHAYIRQRMSSNQLFKISLEEIEKNKANKTQNK